MRCNPKPGHPGYTGPAQIMKSPSSHARQLVHPAFGSTKFLEGLCSEHRQDMCSWRPRAFQHGKRLRGRVTHWGLGFLVPCFGERPTAAREIDSPPLQAGTLSAPLSGERKKLNDPAVRLTDFSSGED